MWQGTGDPPKDSEGGDGDPPYSSRGGLTISPTHCGPGSHCPGPAYRVRTSRAAGSSTTSPAPGETEGRKGAPQNRPPGRGEAGSPARWVAGLGPGLWTTPALSTWGRRWGGTHSSKGRVQGPVAKAVLQEEVQLLLHEPRDGGPAGWGRQQGPGHPAGPGQGLLRAAPSSESTPGAQHRA